MLECYGMDILPYSPDTIYATTDNSLTSTSGGGKSYKEILNVDDAADWCVFAVEVRNTYGLPFEVTFEREQEGGSH